MKNARLIFIFLSLAVASCSSDVEMEVDRSFIEQCLRNNVSEVKLGTRAGMLQRLFISESCFYNKDEHGGVGLPVMDGKLNAVICPKDQGVCGSYEWMYLVFSYYIHPEMLRQHVDKNKYIEEKNGFSVFEYSNKLRVMLPIDSEGYYLTCRYGKDGGYHGCTMNGGLYKGRVRYKLYYRGSFDEFDFHNINDEVNSFINQSVRYKPDYW